VLFRSTKFKMTLIKLLSSLLLVFLLGYGVESCNSNSGSSSFSNCAGASNDSCNDQCRCNATSFLTCIDFKCQCNLNALGGFNSNCSDSCPCKPLSGLECDKNNKKCTCDPKVAVWDTDKCVTFATLAATCDYLFSTVTPPTALPSGTSLFGTTDKSWKCTQDGYIYAPSYNGTTKKGLKFYIKSTPELGTSSLSTCKNLVATRIQPATTDLIYTEVLKRYTFSTVSIWIGAFLDPRYNEYYWDNGTQIDPIIATLSTIGGTSTAQCVVLSISTTSTSTPPKVFDSKACSGSELSKTLCTF